MPALISSSFRAMQSLFAPGMLRVFILSIITTIVVLLSFVIVAGVVFSFLASHLHGHYAYLPWAGTLGAGAIAWLLFPGIMPVIVSFYDNRIADIIERQDYPDAPAHTPKFWPEFWHDVRFSIIMIVLNILVVPLYLFPVLFPFVFYGLNGYLLGREFFVMCARRHMPASQAEMLRRRYGWTVTAAGIGLTLLATIPFLNLFAPFWGIAVMVHLYHRLASA